MQDNFIHKFQLLRLLSETVDNPILSQNIYFKGGTCAALLGYLDRFSVDLDFDLKDGSDTAKLRREFTSIFKNNDLVISNKNEKTLFFELKYQAPHETMFANKLVAPVDRFQKHRAIATRDIYDIHYFFSQGYKFKKEIIEERMKTDAQSYIKILIEFIEKEINETNISQDLNALLSIDKFQKIRKTLKAEVLIFLRSLKTA